MGGSSQPHPVDKEAEACSKFAGARAANSNLGLLLHACHSFFLLIGRHAPGNFISPLSATSACPTHLSLYVPFTHIHTHQTFSDSSLQPFVLAKDKYQTLGGWMDELGHFTREVAPGSQTGLGPFLWANALCGHCPLWVSPSC